MPEHLWPPDLTPEAATYFAAFHELSTDRVSGFSIGAIPFTAIDCYARRFGFDEPDDFRVLLAMVRAMDSEFLAVMNKKSDKGEQGDD